MTVRELETWRRNINRVPWYIRYMLGFVIGLTWLLFGWIFMLYLAYKKRETFKTAAILYIGCTVAVPMLFVFCNAIKISCESRNKSKQYRKWLAQNNIGFFSYVVSDDEIIFLHDYDAVAFKLRWV